jgi:hypothetical protein
MQPFPQGADQISRPPKTAFYNKIHPFRKEYFLIVLEIVIFKIRMEKLNN